MSSTEMDVKKVIKDLGGRMYVSKLLRLKYCVINGWCYHNRIPRHWLFELEAQFKKKKKKEINLTS